MTSSIVVTPKRHFLARKHVVWAIKRENRPNGSTWAQDREKRTGQDRTGQSKMSQRRYISPIWGEAPTEPIFTEICTVVAVPDIITCAKFWTEIFGGLRFYRGRISHFWHWFLHGPYNSAALLRCLWLSPNVRYTEPCYARFLPSAFAVRTRKLFS